MPFRVLRVINSTAQSLDSSVLLRGLRNTGLMGESRPMGDVQPKCGEHQLGLTLLESLTTLAIIAILTGIALPSFREQIAEARAHGAATTLYAAIQFARSAAQRHGQSVVLCPMAEINLERHQCSGHFGQRLGVMTVSDARHRLLRVWPPTEGVSVTNRLGTRFVTGTLSWDAWGVGRRNLTLSVCVAGRNWAVITNRLGRPRLAENWGECPIA